MKILTVSNFGSYLEKIERILSKDFFSLYRGQAENYPLIPSIARKDSKIDTTAEEIEMLSELKRRSGTF
jgi:hypothetical protein